MPILCTRLSLAMLVPTLVFASAVHATEIPIDLNDFFTDPTVIVSADGTSASFAEDPIFRTVLLSNNPSAGEPEVVIPALGRALMFCYEFVEAPGEDDRFLAFILDPNSGVSIGSAFEFAVDASSLGTVAIEIGALVGITLGLQFELVSLDEGPDQGQGNSTLTISNVRLSDPDAVPAPGTGLLCLVGVLGLIGHRRWLGVSPT